MQRRTLVLITVVVSVVGGFFILLRGIRRLVSGPWLLVQSPQLLLLGMLDCTQQYFSERGIWPLPRIGHELDHLRLVSNDVPSFSPCCSLVDRSQPACWFLLFLLLPWGHLFTIRTFGAASACL